MQHTLVSGIIPSTKILKPTNQSDATGPAPSAYTSRLPPSAIPTGVRRIRAALNGSMPPAIRADWVVAVVDTGESMHAIQIW